nr:hypothetical protein Iba_chr01cCG7220 [Ipomoea batatas]
MPPPPLALLRRFAIAVQVTGIPSIRFSAALLIGDLELDLTLHRHTFSMDCVDFYTLFEDSDGRTISSPGASEFNFGTVGSNVYNEDMRLRKIISQVFT